MLGRGGAGGQRLQREQVHPKSIDKTRPMAFALKIIDKSKAGDLDDIKERWPHISAQIIPTLRFAASQVHKHTRGGGG